MYNLTLFINKCGYIYKMKFSIFNKLPGGVKRGYRSDIDGLRAIACLAVVIFHAFPNYLKGGFVGVDIFFVISGFLISSILYRNLFKVDCPGKVNIVDFYIRRVRRIFPALLAVLITTLILGWFILLPDEYKYLGKQVFGGSSYTNNLLLFRESSSYFDTKSNADPLLHLWSLGVEEQFYLVFPLLLWCAFRTKRYFLFVISVLTLLSFVLNVYYVINNQQSAAFYLPWSRFWELSIGAILAYTVNYHKELVEKVKTLITDNVVADTISKFIFRNSNDDLRRNLINNLISIAGLVTIIYGIATINNDITFPGTKALIPVFGALMIIGAGKTSVINKYVLSNSVMVFLGLISYPLYLWHWPLLSLAYICEGQMPSVLIRAGAVVIAVVLATITYFVIEPPLRYGSHSKTKAVCLFCILIFVGIAGIYIYKSNGLARRFADSIVYDFSFTKHHDNFPFSIRNYGGNEVVNGKFVFDDDHYQRGQISGKPVFLLTGDSFARQFIPYLEKNVRYESVVGAGVICYKDLFYDYLGGSQKGIYKNLLDALNKTEASTIVIAHNFEAYENFIPNYWGKLESSMKDLASSYPNKKFILVGQVEKLNFLPEFCNYSKNRLYLREYLRSKTSISHCSINYKIPYGEKNVDNANTHLKNIADQINNFEFVDLRNSLCDGKYCKVYDDKGLPLYSDDHHLSIFGAPIVGKYLLRKIQAVEEY